MLVSRFIPVTKLIDQLKGSFLYYFFGISLLKVGGGGGGSVSLLFGLMVWGAKFLVRKYEASRAIIFGPLFFIL